jgi:hypothetical protein
MAEMMKGFRWPSVDAILSGARHSFARFPVAMLCAVFCCALSWWILDHERGDWKDAETYFRILAIAPLGIAACAAAALFGENPPFATSGPAARKGLSLGFSVVVVLALVGLERYLRGYTSEVYMLRVLHVGILAHLTVAFAPFSAMGRGGVGRGEAFWQYNRSLLERILLAAIYSGSLYGGLAIALVALQFLFGIDVDGKVYAKLGSLIGFVFNTWFFLAGVPRDYAALSERRDYPRALKAFAQYVLLPLVLLYFALLYAYVVKIAVQRAWPEGTVGHLVTWLATLGMLALLLLHPFAEQEGSRWIRRFGRIYYAAIIPLLGLLELAVWRRVKEYGITEPRYALMVLGGWLFALSVFFLVSRGRTIRAIPLSLAVVVGLTFVGPWGMYSVSYMSQAARLKAIFVRNDMWKDGHAVAAPAGKELSFGDRKEISSILEYLNEMHPKREFVTWFPKARKLGEDMRYDYASSQVESLDLKYVGRWETNEEGERLNFWASDANRVVSIKGFDWVLPEVNMSLGRSDDSDGQQEVTLADGTLLILKVHPVNHRMRIFEGAVAPHLLIGEIDLHPLVVKLTDASKPGAAGAPEIPKHNGGNGIVEVDGGGAKLRARFRVKSLYGARKNERWVLDTLSGDLLLTFKK